jgi:hypothetical protein
MPGQGLHPRQGGGIRGTAASLTVPIHVRRVLFVAKRSLPGGPVATVLHTHEQVRLIVGVLAVILLHWLDRQLPTPQPSEHWCGAIRLSQAGGSK